MLINRDVKKILWGGVEITEIKYMDKTVWKKEVDDPCQSACQNCQTTCEKACQNCQTKCQNYCQSACQVRKQCGSIQSPGEDYE